MTTSYDIDFVHSNLGFSVRHLMITRVHGAFSKWTGSIALDHVDPSQSKVAIEIDAASVDTKNPQRDAHLRSADFFDVDQFPLIRFESTQFQKENTGLRLLGTLTLHGVSLPVNFVVEVGGHAADSQGRKRVGYRAQATISRKAFGISWNASYEAGNVVVGDEVELVLDLQLIPRA